MKKVLISIIGVVVMGSALVAGENVPTSKSYVDYKLSQKQDKIQANPNGVNGPDQVLMNTGVAENVGTKNIYDSSAEYAMQTDALVDAGTFNTAVQNAINAEFKCIAWVDDDPTKDCLLVDILGTTPKPSGKNLFNIDNATVLYNTWWQQKVEKNGNGLTVMVPREIGEGSTYYMTMIELGDINQFLGKTLTLSLRVSCMNGGVATYNLAMCNDNCSVRQKDLRPPLQFRISPTPD